MHGITLGAPFKMRSRGAALTRLPSRPPAAIGSTGSPPRRTGFRSGIWAPEQEGVSDGQFARMKNGGVHPVVPSALFVSCPSGLPPEMTTFESSNSGTRILEPMARS